jgi:hypothetical protein
MIVISLLPYTAGTIILLGYSIEVSEASQNGDTRPSFNNLSRYIIRGSKSIILFLPFIIPITVLYVIFSFISNPFTIFILLLFVSIVIYPVPAIMTVFADNSNYVDSFASERVSNNLRSFEYLYAYFIFLSASFVFFFFTFISLIFIIPIVLFPIVQVYYFLFSTSLFGKVFYS